MKSVDIPQDATPIGMRRIVEALESGAENTDELASASHLSERHVSYHLQAARILGFVDRHSKWYEATDLGRRWLQTPEGSAADREVFELALAQSDKIRQLAPGLMSPSAPEIESLTERVRLLGRLSHETAERRAQTLLRYRQYALCGDTVDWPLFPALEGRAPSPGGPRRDDTPKGRPLCHVRVRNYGCLFDTSAPLGRFAIVLGANGCGKTTFFDVMGFLSDSLQTDVQTALLARGGSLEEILWFGQGTSFGFALEFDLPDDKRSNGHTHAHYEVSIGKRGDTIGILGEILYLKPSGVRGEFVGFDKTPRGWQRILSLSEKGVAWYHTERGTWKQVFQLASNKLALSQLPEDQTRFRATLWVRQVLLQGLQRLELNSKAIRQPASPLLEDRFRADGSNLPNVARRLEREDPERFKQWIQHVRTALPDVETIGIVTRPEDKHLYLKVSYTGGLRLPSWRLSDGTLRLLALTLLPYMNVEDRIFLIEEPENGIHPLAIEVVYQALSSCYRSQVLVATHSPVFLGIVPPESLLAMRKEDGKSTMTPGSKHPVLKDWQREADLGTLFASGVL
jgi:predicted ATPase